MSNGANNFLTFDVEEWYHANYPGLSDFSTPELDKRFEWQVNQLLKLCSKYKVKATFFVVGKVAEKYPSVIQKIAAKGHEIASHSYEHKLVYKMSQAKFEQDLQKSIKVLKKLTNQPIIGFRAPSWSIKPKITNWFYRVLAKHGIKYSSSVFPIQTPLYGMPEANPLPHLVSLGKVQTKQKACWEVPNSIWQIAGFKTGFAGGAYLRLLPSWLIIRLIKMLNQRQQSVILYLHPREIDLQTQKLPLQGVEKFFHYYGVDQTVTKMEAILRTFSPTLQLTMGEVYRKV